MLFKHKYLANIHLCSDEPWRWYSNRPDCFYADQHASVYSCVLEALSTGLYEAYAVVVAVVAVVVVGSADNCVDADRHVSTDWYSAQSKCSNYLGFRGSGTNPVLVGLWPSHFELWVAAAAAAGTAEWNCDSIPGSCGRQWRRHSDTSRASRSHSWCSAWLLPFRCY